MGIFTGLFKSRDKPQNSYDSPSYTYFFGRANSGKRVTDRTALQHIAVYACVRVLSEAIAQLPLHVYKYNDKGKERVPQHPLYFLLHDQPNPEMTSFVFRETLMSHLLIYGNAYAQIIRNGRGDVIGLYPLMPDKMKVDRDDKNRLIYIYSRYDEANPNMKEQGDIVLYDDVPDTLSQLIRTAFIPRPSRKFIVADFNSVEARVLAWLAGEDWRMEAFAKGEDIYCKSASKMFGVPVVKHGENGHLRQKGKVAELACIAEGQLVLTDHGLIPIEKVSVSDRVWDGTGWIRHEGVIYKGQQKVITYDGLTATPDHFVWIKGRITPVPFGVAAATGSCLVNTGNDRIALQYSWKDHIFSSNEKTREEQFLNKRKSRVYDLKNAGPNHRFTVSGKLVHNCGYGGSVGAMKAMGADSLGLSDSELKSIVEEWRASSPCITDLWWAVDRAAKKAVKEKTTTETHGLIFSYESGFLFIELPSGRRLAYAKPRIGENQFGGESVTYMGINAQKKWSRLESYGPKFVENCVQGIARDLLMYSMQTLSYCFIVGHVHDEMIIEADRSMSVQEVCQQMSRTPAWAEGLILRAEGYECEYYKKE